MTDSITAEHRSWNMSRIRGKDTKIEVLVRKYLFSRGFRYRKNDSRYPGKPDIILPKYKTAVFVNGCFWHHHSGCRKATIPKTRTEFWMDKFSKNVTNDRKNITALEGMGWNVIVIWECELEADFEKKMDSVISQILKNSPPAI